MQCLIFDFGNVIAFFDHQLAYRQIGDIANPPLTAAEVEQRLHAAALVSQYEVGTITSNAFITGIERVCCTPPSLRHNVEQAWSRIFKPNYEAIQLVAQLRRTRKYRMILASNTNELHFLRIGKQFAQVLGQFDYLVLSYQIGLAKPDPRFFQNCLAVARCAAGDCLYIDDVDSFVQAATRAGMQGRTYSASTTDLTQILSDEGIDVESLVVTNPRPLVGDAAVAIAVYNQKYLQYRHLDTLRWQVPGLVTTFGGLIFGAAAHLAGAQNPDKDIFLGKILLGYGLFAFICLFFLFRITGHHQINTRALRQTASQLGDYSVSLSQSERSPLLSAAMWFKVFITILSIAACAHGASIIWKDRSVTITSLIIALVLNLCVWWQQTNTWKRRRLQ